MKENNTSYSSETNWDIVDALTDEDIDRSELPPLDEAFFARAVWRIPEEQVAVTVQMAPELLSWFKSQGSEYEQYMIAALRIYAEAHQAIKSPTKAGV